MQVKIAGQKTIREREHDHEECEGCKRRNKPVFSYFGRDGEPIVCSKRCLEIAMVARIGGVRTPTVEQAAEIRHLEEERLQRRADQLAAERRSQMHVVQAG